MVDVLCGLGNSYLILDGLFEKTDSTASRKLDVQEVLFRSLLFGSSNVDGEMPTV